MRIIIAHTWTSIASKDQVEWSRPIQICMKPPGVEITNESSATGSELCVPPNAQDAGVHHHRAAYAGAWHRCQLGDFHADQCHSAPPSAGNRSSNSHPNRRHQRLLL